MAEIPTLTYAGDQALLVEFGDSIDIKINNKVRNLMVQLEQSQEDWIMDLVPSYKSLLVIFNPAFSPRKLIETYLLELA
jgi:allophanate hydrolase subunit 1